MQCKLFLCCDKSPTPSAIHDLVCGRERREASIPGSFETFLRRLAGHEALEVLVFVWPFLIEKSLIRLPVKVFKW